MPKIGIKIGKVEEIDSHSPISTTRCWYIMFSCCLCSFYVAGLLFFANIESERSRGNCNSCRREIVMLRKYCTLLRPSNARVRVRDV